MDIRLEGTTTEFEWTHPNCRLQRVLDIFGNGEHPRNLLDIGCGNGYISERIREVARIDVVDGIDIQADRVKAPKWLRLRRVDIDTEDFPYPDNTFDSIYCGEVIEHVYDTDHLLDEIKRVLAPTGFCVITTPNLGSWINRLVLLLGFQPYPVPVSVRYERAGHCKWAYMHGHRGHFRCFTHRGMKELLLKHGFKIVSLEGWDVGDLSIYVHPRILGWTVEKIDRFFSLFPSLGYRLGVVVRREA